MVGVWANAALCCGEPHGKRFRLSKKQQRFAGEPPKPAGTRSPRPQFSSHLQAELGHRLRRLGHLDGAGSQHLQRIRGQHVQPHRLHGGAYQVGSMWSRR